jgi:hypothetical protein
MTGRVGHRPPMLALLIITSSLLAGCSSGTAAIDRSGKPGPLKTLEVDVHVVSPRLTAYEGIVPRNHYWGFIRGAVLTCGPVGVNQSPAQMERHPVTVRLWYHHRLVALEYLSHRSGFQFVVVGNAHPPLPNAARNAGPASRRRPPTMEVNSPWSPTFVLTASDGFRQTVGFGGLAGVIGESLQIPRPQHPC